MPRSNDIAFVRGQVEEAAWTMTVSMGVWCLDSTPHMGRHEMPTRIAAIGVLQTHTRLTPRGG